MNPMEQSHPPDEPITRFTITAERFTYGGRGGDTWLVNCPEWNYHNETNEAIDIHIGRLMNEIKKHNENS